MKFKIGDLVGCDWPELIINDDESMSGYKHGNAKELFLCIGTFCAEEQEVIVIMFPNGRVERVNSCELIILKEAE